MCYCAFKASAIVAFYIGIPFLLISLFALSKAILPDTRLKNGLLKQQRFEAKHPKLSLMLSILSILSAISVSYTHLTLPTIA